MADAKLNIIISATDKASKTIKGISGSFKDMSGKLAKGAAIGLGAVAVGLGAVGVAAVKLAADAAPLKGVMDAFYGIADAAGVGGDAMLDALKKGSEGMVTNRDLMMSFNKAAQLVSVDFAQKLPDAMGYLGKVALATGQDMGYMMDSLVTGVGRLSPMILDNLGITMDMSAAYDVYGESIGKAASELTKAEQQTALMNQVMEKLAENTKDIPDVAGSAQQAFEGFKVALKDVKDQIGLALLPVITPLLRALSDLAMPYLTWVIEKVGKFTEKLSWLVEAMLDAGIQSIEVHEILEDMFGTEIADRIMAIVEWISNLATTIQDFMNNILVPFVREHLEEFKGALMAIGLLLAAGAIVGGILAIVAAITSLMTPLGLIIALVGLLGAAWAGNWFGMRDTLTEFWETTAKPKLEELRAKLAEELPAAIETLRGFWEETLLPALQTVWAYIQDNILPILEEAWEWLQQKTPDAIQTLTDYWLETLLPALQNIWTFLSVDMIPIWEALVNLWTATVDVQLEILAGLWENVLKPALEAVWDFIKNSVIPIFGSMSGAGRTLTGVIDAVAAAINRLADAIRSLPDSLPDWLTGHSPSPIELTFTGMAEALRHVNMQVPRFATNMAAISASTGRVSNTTYNIRRGGNNIFPNNSAAMMMYINQQRQDEYNEISGVI